MTDLAHSLEDLSLNELSTFELAVEDGKEDKVREMIRSGHKVYKKYQRERKYEDLEYLMLKACRFNHIEVVEALLEEYENDYKFAVNFIKDVVVADDILENIFVAYKNDDADILKDIYKTQLRGNDMLSGIKVLLIVKQCSVNMTYCELFSITKNNLKLFSELVERNGVADINIRDDMTGLTPATFVVQKNRADLLQRMVKIGLETNMHSSLFIDALQHTRNVKLLKYLLGHFDPKDIDLLKLTVSNRSSCMFEAIMEFLVRKKFEHEFLTPLKLFTAIRNILDSHPTYLIDLVLASNDKLLNYVLKYDFNFQEEVDGKTAVHYAVHNPIFVNFVCEALSRDFDVTHGFYTHTSVLDEITPSTPKVIVEEIAKSIPNEFFINFKKKTKTIVKLIALGFDDNIPDLSKYVNVIDVNAIYDEEDGNTALHLAIKYESDKLFDKLVGRKPNLLLKNKNEDTVFLLASRFGTKHMLRYFIIHAPYLINVANKENITPIYEILWRCNKTEYIFSDIFEEFLVLSPDLTVRNSNSESLLCSAVIAQNSYFIKRLLELGIKHEPSKCGSDIPLHSAIYVGNIDIFNSLLDSKIIDINLKAFDGNTILHLAASNPDPEFFHRILKLENMPININEKNNDGETALFYCHDYERFRILLDHGANLNVMDNSDRMPYIKYALDYRIDILLHIFTMDLDLTIPTKDGLTLLYILPKLFIPVKDLISKYERVRDMFRKNTNQVYEETGMTPVFVAAKYNLECLEFMFELTDDPIDLELMDLRGETALFDTLR